VAAIFPHIPPMPAKLSLLFPRTSGQVEGGGEPAEVKVFDREVDADATVAKFSPTTSVNAVAFVCFHIRDILFS